LSNGDFISMLSNGDYDVAQFEHIALVLQYAILVHNAVKQRL